MTQMWSDDDRIVELDEEPLLPEQTRDDTDTGWGEGPGAGVDERLLDERPPHWD